MDSGYRNDRLLPSALMGLVTDAIVVCFEDSSIQYMNPAAHDLLDISEEGVSSLKLKSFIHPDDHSTFDSIICSAVCVSSNTKCQEIRLKMDLAEGLWVSCQALPIRWGRESAVAFRLKDISDLKEAEISLQNTRNLFLHLFRMTPDIMILSDMDKGIVLDVNPAFLNVMGLRRDDTVGTCIKSLPIWSNSAFIRRFLEELKMTPSMTEIPVALTTRGDAIRHFLLFAERVEQQGSPMMCLMGRDVTDDLFAAQELKKSKDIADLANRTKSQFLANMSHELRTPLNAILGFSEILRDEILGPIGHKSYAEYAGDIHESGSHLLSIINDILDLSKVEAGKIEAYIEWIDPTACLDMTLKILKQRAIEAGVTLEQSIEQGLLIEADERLMKQIGLNLLSNAIKFTDAGGTIHLLFFRTANGGACLSVKDTGIGMSQKDIQVARLPFGQVDSTLSRNHTGSGLGLPLVNAFAEKMQAKMVIDSEPGIGTNVNIVFPPARVQVKKPDDTSRERRPEEFI